MRISKVLVAVSAHFLLQLSLGAQAAAAAELPGKYDLGRTPTTAEVEAWSITVMPDGTGLPAGRGSVAEGGSIYAAKCASCHGVTGAEGPYETLVGTRSIAEFIRVGERPKRTIGNLWPHAPVLFDYIRRTMPFAEPGSLNANELYSVVAWLLYRNGVVPENAIIDAASLRSVRMPAAGVFVEDPRRPWVLQ